MPLDTRGNWYPPLSPKQILAYNDNATFLLMSGPRYCGKSIVGLHKAVKHAFSLPNARVGIFLRSTKVGKTGIWSDLIRTIIPIWEENLSDDGFQVTVREHQAGDTRMTFTRIKNIHGGESEIQLHSVHHDEDLEDRFKSTSFSMQLFDELDVYTTSDIFLISKQQLRLPGIPFSKHQWIGICNPPEDGTDSWIYTRWYVDALDKSRPESFRNQYNHYDFTLADNIFGDPLMIENLKQDYLSDPEKYDRFVLGKWTASSGNSIFAGAFRSNFHIRGDGKDTTILPSEKCTEIIVGSDIGDVNHAVTFLEHVHTPQGDYWTVLDEIYYIKQDISLEMLTYEMLAKMQNLEKLADRKLNFVHWSDRSAVDSYRAASDAPDHILVHRFSNGQIQLQGCPKTPKSISLRISLLRRLLTQNKIFISGNCTAHVEMLKKLKKGTRVVDPIKRNDPYKHPFDSLTYALYGELIDDLIDVRTSPNEKEIPLAIRSI